VKGFRQVLISLLALAFVLAAAGVDAQQVDPKPYGGMPCQPNTYYFEVEKPQGAVRTPRCATGLAGPL
jgi:hypothetical protein